MGRDLHDTLEQELSGLAILLHTSAQQFESGDRAPDQTLGLARQLLRRSREESRSCEACLIPSCNPVCHSGYVHP
ncbi:MAG: histidine kinase dimerization/phosphoacceptor domain-containing protein [Prosthecobacter sp.]|uniref:histidine kinase dimerization/phosphoacceptor domain-containing protein n=1 Tax=Prosthecobacter sp. TaxID=1965333 RepID=UPI0038FEB9B2